MSYKEAVEKVWAGPSRCLEGIKVADFMWQGAGPWGTAMLADFGAMVVRIESETVPDVARITPPYKDNIPGYNRAYMPPLTSSSKYSMAVDLKTGKGREVAKRLVRWADIVTENFGPGTMKRLGLDYETLRQGKPDIIMLSSCMQGQTGPHARFVGFGPQLTGPAGFYPLSGWPDREPIMPHIAYTDHVAPWYTVVAVLAALDYRDRTGQGQYIDQSQLESAVTFLAGAVLDYTFNRREQLRQGNRDPQACPHGVFPCQGEDRWMALAVHTQEEWGALCRVMEKPELASDPRFASLKDRKGHEAELEALVAAWTRNFPVEGLVERLQAAGVAAGIVQNAEDLFQDPQLKHRRFFHFLEHPELGTALQYSWSTKLSRTPLKHRVGPCLGQDTEFVCREVLGMPEEEFIELLMDGVLK